MVSVLSGVFVYGLRVNRDPFSAGFGPQLDRSE